jgi:hypothetical protein
VTDDQRPQPRYGQYAPVPPVSPAPAPPAARPDPPAPLPPPVARAHDRPRRTWDVVLTTLLLLIGVYDVVTGFTVYGNLSAPLQDVFEQQGIGEFTSDALAVQVGVVLNVLRVMLIAAAVVLGLMRINRNRIAFWVPLGAGAISVLATLVASVVLIVSDPAFSAFVESTQ